MSKKQRKGGILFGAVICLLAQVLFSASVVTAEGKTVSGNNPGREAVSGNNPEKEAVPGSDEEKETVSGNMPGNQERALLTAALSGDTKGAAEFSYTGGIQTFTADKPGIYKLEVYGAAGGNQTGYTVGGKGGYSYGYAKLKKGDVCYVCVGGAGSPGIVHSGGKGGYNGGGSGGYAKEEYYNSTGGGGGGGATHIAKISGTLEAIGASNKGKIYIIAGGGGGGGGQTDSDRGWGSNGGAGGGTVGGGARAVNHEAGGLKMNLPGATQSKGFAFGKGEGGLWNYCDHHHYDGAGGGGGGFYGGYFGFGDTSGIEVDYTKCGGSGGSGYIGGVPAFSYGGTSYTPETTAGIRSGAGYAKITLVKPLFGITMAETEIEKIERQEVKFCASVNGVKAYEWQIQSRKEKEVPAEEDWEKLVIDEKKYRQSAELDEGGNGKITLSFSAETEDAQYWYRLSITGEENSMAGETCHIRVIPLKMDYLEISEEMPALEAGTVLESEKIAARAVCNNNDIIYEIQKIPELLKQLYFLVKGENKKEYCCKTVGDTLSVALHLEHRDNPGDAELHFRVIDTKKPEIEQVLITIPEFFAHPSRCQVDIKIDAADLSDGELEYWLVKESDQSESEHNHTGEIRLDLEDNEEVTVYVKDSSGNTASVKKKVVFVDEEAPEITGIYVKPEGEWKKGYAEVRVEAEDSGCGLAKEAYSFDGGKTWKENNTISLPDSAVLQILVRDRVGNQSQVRTVILEKKGSSNQGNGDTEELTGEEGTAELTGVSRENAGGNLRRNKKRKNSHEEEDISEVREEDIPTDGSVGEGPEKALQQPENRSRKGEELKKDEAGVPLSDKAGGFHPFQNIPPEAAAGAAATGSAGGISLIFFLFFRKADIYYVNELLDEEYAGSVFLHRKKQKYSIRISGRVLEERQKGKFCVKISRGFARRKSGKYLEILTGHRIINSIKISEKMYFYI